MLDLNSITVKRLLKLLSSGVSATAAASAAGCDKSYVSQLLDNPTFKQELAKLASKGLEDDIKFDNKIDELENTVLSMMEVSARLFTKPRDLIALFQTLNNAKRRVVKNADESPTQGGALVTFSLPPGALGTVQLKLNNQSQVIEVDNRGMTPMNVNALPNMLKNRLEERQKQKDGYLTIADIAAKEVKETKEANSDTEQEKNKEFAKTLLASMGSYSGFLQGVPNILETSTQ
jgi:hypothetical protein